MTTAVPPSSSASGVSRRGRLIIALVALLLLAIVAPLMILMVQARALRDLITTNTRVTSRLAAARPMFAYAPPVDSSVTPLAAGQALWALQTTIAHVRPSDFPQHEDAPFTLLPMLEADDAPFRDILSAEAPLPDPAKIIARARRGFTAAELVWLRDLARHPVWQQVAIVARAPALDQIAGRLVLPLPDGAQPFDLPIVRFGEVRRVSLANASRVALLLSEGKRAEAERALAEPFGIARTLADGTYLIDILIGATLVRGSARQALEAYYRATNDPRLNVIPSAEVPQIPRDSSVQSLADRIATTRDPQLVTAERLENLTLIAVLDCASPGAILFGRSPETADVFRYARDSVARTDGEREMVRIAESMPASIAHGRRLEGPALAARIVNLAGWVLGNERMRGCARTFANVR